MLTLYSEDSQIRTNIFQGNLLLPSQPRLQYVLSSDRSYRRLSTLEQCLLSCNNDTYTIESFVQIQAIPSKAGYQQFQERLDLETHYRHCRSLDREVVMSLHSCASLRKRSSKEYVNLLRTHSHVSHLTLCFFQRFKLS